MKAETSPSNSQLTTTLLSKTRRRLGGACLAAGITPVAIGTLVLVGWFFKIETLKRVVPGLVAMNPVSALLFILSGTALLLMHRKAHLNASRKMIVRSAAIFTAAIGALKLFSLITGWTLGIDQWLFTQQLMDAQTGFLNRMAPNTAFNFLLIGCALLLIDTRSRRGHRPAEFLSTVSAVSALLALIGYAYRVPSFYEVGSLIPMALHTATSFLILAVGILLARADDGIATVFASDTAGGIVARRLLPLAILLPTGLGALALEGGRLGFYDAEFGSVIYVTLLILLFLGLTWWMAGRLYRLDTERNAARKESDRFFNVSLDMLATAGFDGYFKRLNPPWEKTLEWSVEQLKAAPFMEFVHPDDRAATTAESAKLATGLDTIAFENRYRCKDGTYRWFLWSAAADLEMQLIFASARDITGRKEIEKALAQAKEEADRANHAKSEFLSRMSHELRTPLNAILGFGQLLELDDLDADQQESVRHILSGGRHLLDLINEVLDISRIEAGRMTISSEPVSLPDLLRDVVTLVGPLAREREIKLFHCPEKDVDFFVCADRQRLKQVLLNLLSNAIKYNRQAGEVRIETRRHHDKTTGTEMVRVEVTDSGAGLSAEKLEQLFTPFQRLGAEKTNVDGTGLGLALSKRLVELMQGHIGVESAPEKGSTFWIELPATENPLEKIESVVESAPENSSVAASATVLYIEDNPSNLRLVERILMRRPEVRLLSTPQGKAGIELARKHKPDLILLDLHLPDIQGQEVLKTLRSSHTTDQIPIVVISADATPGQVQRLKEAGAHAYLTKPIAVPRFMKILDETLKAVGTDGA